MMARVRLRCVISEVHPTAIVEDTARLGDGVRIWH